MAQPHEFGLGRRPFIGAAAWGSAAANGRVRAMSAEVRILALRHQREIGFLP